MITICTTEFRSLASRQAAGRHPRRTGAGGGAAAAAAMAPPRGPGLVGQRGQLALLTRHVIGE